MEDQTTIDDQVEQYLTKYNFAKALVAFRAERESGKTGGPAPGSTTTSLDEFAKANAPTAIRKDDNALREWRAKVDQTGWLEGLRGLTEFVQSALDIHRTELLPIIPPMFVHVYLDFIRIGQVEAAKSVMRDYQNELDTTHRPLLAHLASITTESQIDASDQVKRWRTERYKIRMTPRGKGLLLGWLQSSTLLPGKSSDVDPKGRDKMMSILNFHVTIEELPANTPVSGIENGFASDLMQPRVSGSLTLGVPPVDGKLAKEAVRVYNEKTTPTIDEDVFNVEAKPDLTAPPKERLPPFAATMRQVDIEREVGKLKEARKRIRLGPEAFAAGAEAAAPVAPTAAKPSVCLFTLHDTRETLVSSTISEDSTLMACGFSESYIRIWDTRGPRLMSARSDFDPSTIKSPQDLKKLKDKSTATQTRKLIGHGGPVYTVSFDPTAGAASQPRFLLSGSQDSTVRLWSLDTFSAVVSYRGHRDPVWDVDWSPRGTYFASASRDRTARVWITDRTSPLRIMAGHLSDVDVVRFHPNTLYLGTASSDRTCRLWDVQTGHCVRVFSGHTAPVSSMAFSPDGRYLASAGDDMNVNLWDIASGRVIKSMPGHTARVDALAFSAESNLLASAAADNTIRFWDVSAGASASKTGGKEGGGGANGVTDSATSRQALQQTLDKASATIGVLPRSAALAGAAEPESTVCRDLLCTLLTKRTPVNYLRFTQRNLCLAVGPSIPDAPVGL